MIYNVVMISRLEKVFIFNFDMNIKERMNTINHAMIFHRDENLVLNSSFLSSIKDISFPLLLLSPQSYWARELDLTCSVSCDCSHVLAASPDLCNVGGSPEAEV